MGYYVELCKQSFPGHLLEDFGVLRCVSSPASFALGDMEILEQDDRNHLVTFIALPRLRVVSPPVAVKCQK